MARLAASSKESKSYAGSATPLTEVSPNSNNNRDSNLKPKKKRLMKQSNQLLDESHASEAQVTSRKQRLFKLDHVDSMTLPSLNGISAKSFEQGLLAAVDDVRGRLRATPKRVAKERVIYTLPEMSPRQENSGLVESDWSELEKSQEEEEEDSEVEELSPRVLWRSPGKELLKDRHEIVDLSSPRKQSTKEKEAVVVNEPRQMSRKLTLSDSDSDAILSFSPPRSRSPRKQPPAPPTQSRPVTPLASPVKSKLTSPTKTQKLQAPPKPHRPSLDSFWSQEVINAWTDEYSPKKILHSPRKLHSLQGPEDDHTPTPSSPSKSPGKTKITPAARAAAAAKKAFDTNKHNLAESFLAELDNTITSGSIARLSASTGGVKIVWTNKLNTTAGRANWKCETIRTSTPGTSSSTNACKAPITTETHKIEYRHHASIELASKVIDNDTRLLNVLAHEYCHLANFMISRVRDQPHGASFQKWAKEVSRVFGGRGVEVTTKHSYEISYKYAWICVGDAGSGGCGMEYERHSRSVDPKRHTCGACKGRLAQIRPSVRKAAGAKGAVGEKSEGRDGDGANGAQSAYQKFVKEQFKVVREELGMKSPMKDVMKEVGARYRSMKGQQGSKPMGGSLVQAESPTRLPTKEKMVEVVVIDDTDDEVVDDVDELDLPSVLDALTIRDD